MRRMRGPLLTHDQTSELAETLPSSVSLRLPPSPARGEGSLGDDERRIFNDALILIMEERHEELNVAVAAAYGWPAYTKRI